MTWVDLSGAFGYGAQLTSTQMQNLRDNIAAAFAKDSGAPEIATDYIESAMIDDGQILEAHMSANSVDRNALKITSTTASASSATSHQVALQDYCLAPNWYASRTAEIRCNNWSSGNYTCRFYLYDGGASFSYTAYYRYVTASNDWFLYVVTERKTGKVVGLWLAEDPPSGYSRLKEMPKDFMPPIVIDSDKGDLSKKLRGKCYWQYNKEAYEDLQKQIMASKKMPYDVLNDFEYNETEKIFKPKNLAHV